VRCCVGEGALRLICLFLCYRWCKCVVVCCILCLGMRMHVRPASRVLSSLCMFANMLAPSLLSPALFSPSLSHTPAATARTFPLLFLSISHPPSQPQSLTFLLPLSPSLLPSLPPHSVVFPRYTWPQCHLGNGLLLLFGRHRPGCQCSLCW
jgi:hypothetical protein